MWWIVGLVVVVLLMIALLSVRQQRANLLAPSDEIIVDSAASKKSIDNMLLNYGAAVDIGTSEPTTAIHIINTGLDCSVKPITGDQCPEGYLAARRSCAEGYCCVLKEIKTVDNARIVLAFNLGVNLIAAEALERMIRETAKQGSKAAAQIALQATIKAVSKQVTKSSSMLVAKITTKLAMISTKLTNPVTAAVAAAELVNMAIDLYDPRGFSQFTSSEAFSAVRDRVEHDHVTRMKEEMPGPPFLYPIHKVLTEKVKTSDGEADVCQFAAFSEVGTSIAWLAKNKPDVFSRIAAAAIEGAISIVDSDAACVKDTDACSAHTDAASCEQDPSGVCAYVGDACINSNFIVGLLEAVPLTVRDAHFYGAIKKVSPKSTELVTVFDRRVHTWFKGPSAFPYAVSLSAAGRDRANALRVEISDPSAYITRDYRDIGTGVWTLREKNVELDGVSDIDKTNTTLNTITTVPRMTDKTIPEPLCLLTMNEYLRPLCEDEKKGGIFDLINTKNNDKLGLKDQPPASLPRDNLNPGLYGVRFDPNKAHCTFTKEYCAQAGLETAQNQLGNLDCRLAAGQGVAELIFGTTLVRSVVASAENSTQTIGALLDPRRYYKKKPGEMCKALTECNGVQNRKVGEYVTCCPATKDVGEEVLKLASIGGALMLTGPVGTIAGLALLDKAAQLPRTCQVMDWTRTGLKNSFCPFDPANPTRGTPLNDGVLCGLGSTCERCASKTQSFWKSKGFTACGTEPKWEDGKRCGPGVTCDMCKNGSAAWDDGAHRCGPRVAGTTVGFKGACAYNNHCIAHTDPKEGNRTMCCDGKCERAVLHAGAWYCPGGVLGKTQEGGKCTIGGTCEGFTSLTERVGCCEGACRKQTKVDGLWRCPSELVKDKEDGTLCTASQCLRCKNKSTFWYTKAREACGAEPRWPDGKPCAAGTSCNSCLKKASIWSDAKIRCGTQGKTWQDGTFCGAGTTCKYCINAATQWRNGSWYCGEQPAARCCADAISFDGKCLLKTSLPKVFGRCTAGLYDPGDGKCHGATTVRC